MLSRAGRRDRTDPLRDTGGCSSLGSPLGWRAQKEMWGKQDKIHHIPYFSQVIQKLFFLKKKEKNIFLFWLWTCFSRVVQVGNYNRIIQKCDNMARFRGVTQWRPLSRRGFWIAADEPNAGKKEKNCTHLSRIYPLTERKVGGWLFPFLASSAGHVREIKIKTLHNWKKLRHPEIDLLLIWHQFQPPTPVRGPSTTRQLFEMVINFPQQSRAELAGFQKF